MQQMRLIHRVPFQASEIENYRQLIFNNLTHGLRYVIENMDDMTLQVSPENEEHVKLIENASDIRDSEAFPMDYFEPLKALWNDSGIQKAIERGNEAALPEKYVPFVSWRSRLIS
jgi:guanine nucleotide-binding protein subunit alpha, other